VMNADHELCDREAQHEARAQLHGGQALEL
jgi:hypothetical protein